MKRYGSTIRVRPEMIEEYKRLHVAVWPDVLRRISACKSRNYSISVIGYPLFSYFEYTGNDFDADMKKMADDPVTQRWWAITKPCQERVPEAQPGEWWATMEEVFHTP